VRRAAISRSNITATSCGCSISVFVHCPMKGPSTLTSDMAKTFSGAKLLSA